MIDFSKIRTYPIGERKNKFTLAQMIPVDNDVSAEIKNIKEVASGVRGAGKNGALSLVMLGGAVVKVGCSDLIIDLMEKEFIGHLAVNGAVSIHDFEMALIGETSEDVVNGLKDGTFGMVEETGKMMNEALAAGYKKGLGYGRAIGEYIKAGDFPHREHSIFYRALVKEVPVTVHIAVGGDIIHQHPACSGEALGATSFTDFKILTESVGQLTGGALLNVGSAVNLPEAFLKALTIARNLGFDVRDFLVADFDFLDMYRPRTRLLEWPKSLGCRTFAIRANHNESIPVLHRLVTRGEVP